VQSTKGIQAYNEDDKQGTMQPMCYWILFPCLIGE
jgi:hypothetical protein